MHYYFKKSFLFSILLILLTTACAGSNNIFPSVPTATDESTVILPNPISVVADTTNSQIIVANSNVDIFFRTGSLAVLSVDATDANAPILSAAQIMATPNFAGQLYFDSANSTVYLPFREASTTDLTSDQIKEYSVAAGLVTEVADSTIANNPFGITGDSAQIYIVSDTTLSILGLDLSALATVDLATASAAGIALTNSTYAESIALDATHNRAIISNPSASLFVVDLTTNALTSVITGPQSTRSLVVDGNILYALDPLTSLVWIFDLDQLDAPTTTPGSIDDATFLLDTIPVGSGATGMALDTSNQKLYVANSTDNTISVIDTLTRTEVARISVAATDLTDYNRGGDSPYALTLGTFNGTEYLIATGYTANSVVLINTTTLKVVAVYPNNTL